MSTEPATEEEEYLSLLWGTADAQRMAQLKFFVSQRLPNMDLKSDSRNGSCGRSQVQAGTHCRPSCHGRAGNGNFALEPSKW